MFLRSLLASFRRAHDCFSRLSRANRPTWKKIYIYYETITRSLSRGERSKSCSSGAVDGLVACLSLSSPSRIPCFRCLGNDLTLGSVRCRGSAVFDNPSQHCSTTPIFPAPSYVSSSSFSRPSLRRPTFPFSTSGNTLSYAPRRVIEFRSRDVSFV
jgi:hypothetical protein